MAWLELTIGLKAQDPQPVETCLEEHGALAITLTDAGDQPLLEPGVGETPLWHDVKLTALFDADVDRPSVERALTVPATALTWQTLDDRQWEREWLTRFRPQQFGQRLWVIPGDTPPVDSDAVNVRLDPGLAFGTGDHETTAMCLRWLGNQPAAHGQRVLDFGCGSGILAIAAVKLGATCAVAVDIDPQALLATRDNAARNGVANKLTTDHPDALTDETFDVVLANILAAPLIELAPAIAGRVAPGGALVLSGILENQSAQVMAAYAPWIAFADPEQDGDWICLHGRRT
jgi:ribosomal protein L11 methyltransferase